MRAIDKITQWMQRVGCQRSMSYDWCNNQWVVVDYDRHTYKAKTFATIWKQIYKKENKK